MVLWIERIDKERAFEIEETTTAKAHSHINASWIYITLKIR